ncbi:MAG: hypothetical protein V7767_08115 [Leeuwenhoekiella sp.]
MIKILFLFISVITVSYAQEIDPDLLEIRKRLEAIDEFTADLQLDVDIDFINMPTKYAQMSYQKGEDIKFTATDFVLIPKRGLDLPLNEIFKYSFITVDRGLQQHNSVNYKMINVIPTDDRADFSIATLLLDTVNKRIVETQINTKKDGAYSLKLNYEGEKNILPAAIEVDFEIDRMKIPLRYMGKAAEVDKEKYRSKEPKTGKIYLKISNYSVKKSAF